MENQVGSPMENHFHYPESHTILLVLPFRVNNDFLGSEIGSAMENQVGSPMETTWFHSGELNWFSTGDSLSFP